MFRLIKKMFIGLLISIVNAFSHTKCMSLSNQESMIEPTFINLHPNEYSQEFRTIHLRLNQIDVGSFNTLNDLSNKACVPSKTEDLNLIVFNIIKGINESKTLTKHISCECECQLDGKKINTNQWWNNDKCQCECKKRRVCEKDYIWNPSACSCENGKYLASIMDDSLTICNEIIDAEEAKTISKNITCKTQNFYILLAFLLIVFASLIAVSIYYYLIKYSAKKKHCHFTLQIIFYIGYVTIKDLKHVKIISVNPLYLIFNKVNG